MGPSLVEEHRLYGMWASVIAVLRLSGCGPRVWGTGSVALVHKLSYSAACRLFLDQGSNPYVLHWQVDYVPLNHLGSPLCHLNFVIFSQSGKIRALFSITLYIFLKFLFCLHTCFEDSELSCEEFISDRICLLTQQKHTLSVEC